jgi:two-component system LytT family response regulator
LSLKSIEELLPANQFVKIHRSFIVNFKEVTTIERNRIVFENKIYIPISEQYKESVEQRIDRKSEKE